MHLFHVATLFMALTLAGVEFSVSAFINPSRGGLKQHRNYTCYAGWHPCLER